MAVRRRGAASLEMQYVDRACGRIDAQLVGRAAVHMMRIRRGRQGP
jgi:hypothetical protein